MKTTLITISMIFLLGLNNIFAGNDLESPVLSESISESLLKSLAPVTPKEANFEEESNGTDKILSIGSLAPARYVTANFDDTIPTEMSIQEILQLLAPKSPREVDFTDPVDNVINPRLFMPVAPHEGLFEELK